MFFFGERKTANARACDEELEPPRLSSTRLESQSLKLRTTASLRHASLGMRVAYKRAVNLPPARPESHKISWLEFRGMKALVDKERTVGIRFGLCFAYADNES